MKKDSTNYQKTLIDNADESNTYLMCGWRLHQVSAYNEALRYEKGQSQSKEWGNMVQKGINLSQSWKNKKQNIAKEAINLNSDNDEAIFLRIQKTVVKYKKQ